MFDKFTLIYGWMKKRSVFDLIDAFTTAFDLHVTLLCILRSLKKKELKEITIKNTYVIYFLLSLPSDFYIGL